MELNKYRHKVQYPVSRTKNSGRILAGYYKPKTHEIVNIKYCPIQPAICDNIINFIREKAFDFGVQGFFEKNGFFQNDISVQAKNGKKFRDAEKALDEVVEPDYDEAGEYCGGKFLQPQSGIKKEDVFL